MRIRNLYNLLGTQKPYVAPVTYYTKPPKGYMPIYINHLGRHGARYLSKDIPIEDAYKELLKAKEQQGLTKKGLALLKDIEKLIRIEAGKFGLLTTSGVEMEEGIAKRMYKNFPSVFTEGKEISAVSTYVERTKESMDAFVQVLKQVVPPMYFSVTSNGKVDPVLRFFDLNTDYLAYKKDGKWKKAVSEYALRTNVPQQVLAPLFKPFYYDSIKDPVGLATSLFSFFCNQFDVQQYVGLSRYFTREQLLYFWENKNVSAYLEKGPSFVGENLPTNISFALLEDFISTTTEALHTRKVAANLRFAHAETIIPFASLLGLPGYATQTNQLEKIATLWKDYEVSPMAANMQWIFYAHPSQDRILVKLLYNEREMSFPLPSVVGPYYDWDKVDAYYRSKLIAIGVPTHTVEDTTLLVEKYPFTH